MVRLYGAALTSTSTPATGRPAISGTARVGQTLTASTSGISDADGLTGVTYAYQWIRNNADIDGATSSTYTLVTDDAGHTIKVKVDFTDDASNAESLTSLATGTVADPTLLVKNTLRHTGDGSFAGNTHHAQAFSTGANAGGYTLSSIGIWFGDIASISTLGSEVTATLNDGSGSNPGSALCTLTDPASFSANGVNTFSAPTTCPTLDPNATYFFVIRRTAVLSSAELGRTSSNHEDPGSAAGWSIANNGLFGTGGSWQALGGIISRIIVVRGENAAPSNPATGRPTISGTARVGQTLTASTSGISDADGLSSPGYTYQWIRNDGSSDSGITGETGSTYTLVTDDAGHTIKMKVDFTDDASNAESLISLPTAAVQDPTLLVKNTLQSRTSSAASLYLDIAKRAQSFTTGSSPGGYTLSSIGIRFETIQNTATAVSELSASLNAAATDSSNEPIPGAALCTLSDPGSFQANAVNTFTAPTSGTLCPTLQPSTTYFFAIERANLETGLILVSATHSGSEDLGSAADWTIADEGHLLSSGSWLDDPSSLLIVVRGESAVPNNPATGTASIRGTARAGELLRARLSGLSDADGIPSGVSYTYQWLVDGTAVAGADGPAYLPWDDDIGKTVRVRVGFTDSLGHAETLTSAATAAVAASPHGQVIWSSTLTAGLHSLAHGYSTISAFGVMEGQALSDDNFIHRATHTVIHVDSERGAVVTGRDLRFAVDPAAPGTAPATWTLLVGNAEFRLSDAGVSEIGAHDAHTWENAGLNWTQGDKVALGLLVRRMAATGAPTIDGIAVVDQTLTADLSGISEPNGIDESTLAYQWVSVDRGTDTDIPGATGSAYTVKQADLGKRIKVRVSFTDGDGYEEGPLESLAVGPVEGVLPPTVDYFRRAGTYQDAISVAWTSVRGAAEYKLEMRKQGEEEWTRITRGDFDRLPSTTDHRMLLGIATGLECGKTYDFRISLRGDGTTFATLFGPYAETTVPLTAMVGLPWTACPKPDQPTNIRVLEEPDCATLTWTPPTNDDWTGVRIRRLTLVADTRGGPGWETIYERLNDSRTRYQDCKPTSGTSGYGVEGNAYGYSVYYIKEEDGVIRQSRRTASSPSEDYLTVLAGQRQWIATTNFAGCPGRPPDSFANSAVLNYLGKGPDALGWPIDPCFPVQIDPKAEQFEQVVAGADQRPFAVHLLQSPQQELPESPALLDLAEYRLHSLHPQSVALPTPLGL